MNIHSVVPAAVKLAKRTAILDAALELFGSRGFHGTPVPMVAELAGVGAGTIYRYFASKEALVNSVYQREKQKLFSAIFSDFPYDDPPRKQFQVYWSRMSSFALGHPEATLFLDLHHHAPYLDETSRGIETQMLSAALSYLEVAKSQEVVKDLPSELLIGLIHGAFVGMMKAAMNDGLEVTPEIVKAAEECCWEMIRR